MQNLLVLTDFSDRALRAAEIAVLLASNNAKSVILYHSIVLPETGFKYGNLILNKDEDAQRHCEALLKLTAISDHLKTNMNDNGLAEVPIILKTGMGAIPNSITTLVREFNVWMIVMGNRVGGEWRNVSFGSNVTPVTDNATCPVLLVP